MYTNILVPVVLDPEHPPTAALEVAEAISEDGARITLLHVIEELPGYATSYLAADFIEKSRADVKATLNSMASGVKGGEAMVVTGHSARSILEWAETHSNDCIIVSSHKPGIQDYFLGGTAARVVRYAQCAVHVVR
ncbi:nucleotide-binding universal stress UspA family protein [Litoreibacter ponti]|uniref:Nucleotide-binding universal stress UspA family protein n=1 Tax=Litoreibacter ponti TaxID=1510457 RepID=A0A2T6BFF4_9RHOB|nr:universal stress protein [Litoreibacter ponti]PTX54792.1 nucleotide-binding universal stress UspA family protein [Litoreibacter ponti]